MVVLDAAAADMAAPLRWFLLGLVLSSTGASFLDTEQPVIFQNRDRSFGHQVAQLEERVIVSAPRYAEVTDKTGQIYSCSPRTSSCTPIPVTESDDDINISLGFSLVASEDHGQLLACGPTLQRICGQNIYVNGRCYQLDRNLSVRGSLSEPPPECGLIVFVIDGSGSVGENNFKILMDFVKQMISSFSKTETKFALLQYSAQVTVEFTFRKFSNSSDLNAVSDIKYQFGANTRTATAIRRAVRDVFIPLSQKDSMKLLIVITDGQSNGERITIADAASEAEKQGIQRISIGVGNAFSVPTAYEELRAIASSPDNIFKVNDFSALNEIQKLLQQKIFAIEGTQSLTGQSFEMEFSQEGFSAALSPDGVLLGAVGAFGWTGGAYHYRTGQEKATWINITKFESDLKDSYMGYSVLQMQPNIVAMGAPRYQHTGRVFVFNWDSQRSQWNTVASALGEQIGSYFGSALGVVKITTSTFVLVVGAPTYYSPLGPGGRVYLCPISSQEMNPRTARTTFTCPEILQGESSQPMGHFGSALAILPDLTADELPDLAVGAPFEDNGQGALYIFPGKDGGFRTSYIQRVAGRLLTGGIQFFGRSLASSLDLTNDGLPDVTAGGEGVAVILRSRPVLQVSVVMSFSRREFPLSSYECPDKIPQTTEIRVCFNKKVKSRGVTGATSASVHYTLVLDAGRTLSRAVFSGTPQNNTRVISSSQELIRSEECVSYRITLPNCVEDSLTPLRVSLNFSLSGIPILSEDSRTNQSGEILFEKNCGADGVCEDDLRINLSFSGLQQLVVGLSLEVNLTVSVTNSGDESYNSRVLIPFPPDLSYRRVSLLQSNKQITVTCASEEDQRVVTCGVNRPLLRPNTTAIFLVSFHVAQKADLGDSLNMTANVTSDNGRVPNELMRSSSAIKVLYSIYVTITSLEESTKYENYTSPEPSIKHVYRVTNQGLHQLSLSVTFLIPVRLGESIIWETPNINSSEPQLTTCRTVSETGGEQNHRELLKESPVLNCSVGTCLRTDCSISNLKDKESVTFTISGPVRRHWETQTDQEKVLLQSSAEIHYDTRVYFMEQNFTKAQAQTVLEVNVEYNYLPVIIGSSFGGLALLALITAGLYKLGFFKRQYKDMLDNTAGDSAGDATATDPPTNGGPE
ncbi:integrin alpha-M-like isoform X2 [Bufo bufo]|uniref:integrin alpha-M-like isoform X2 n=1 Tax=Bufo bufo TaxID=8384 RepID=UPI001ABDF618|nr:integrin alpha-M-like isoform X2 [Bufo bufo]